VNKDVELYTLTHDCHRPFKVFRSYLIKFALIKSNLVQRHTMLVISLKKLVYFLPIPEELVCFIKDTMSYNVFTK